MGLLTEEIAIDLGTANTLIIHNNKVVVDSPSIVAIDRTTNKIIAIGDEARSMVLLEINTPPKAETGSPARA